MNLGTLWRGAVAGLAGSAGMHAFRLCWDSATAKKPEHGIFGFDREADVNASRLLYAMFSNQIIQEDDAAAIGLGMHYAYGTAVGALYAVLASHRTLIRLGFGTAFGSFLWLFGDELPISLSGVSHPLNKSAASHVAALASHLLFGATVELVTRVAVSAGSASLRNESLMRPI